MDQDLKTELSKHGIFATSFEELYNWGRKNSVWPMQFGLACCAIEMIATTMARYDLARFGGGGFGPWPRRGDRISPARPRHVNAETNWEFPVPVQGEHGLGPPANRLVWPLPAKQGSENRE